jgi:dienelactone hydrolase
MAALLIRPCRGIVSAALLVGLLASCTSTRPTGADPLPVASLAPTSVRTSSAPPPSAPAPEPPTTARTVPSTVPAGPPYPIGEVTLALVDQSRPTVSAGRTISATRALTTLVWFPRTTGRWPLVVFAHGFQVSPQPYTTLLESWASHGYVVAAPEFPLTDQAVAGPYLDESDIQNQPADVRFVTDQLLSASSSVATRIDPGRVAAAGHSDGAETALAASTARVPPGEPAYRAVIVLSGQPVPAGARPNPPILVVQGDADTINPPSLGYATWDQAASPRYLLVMSGAGHLPPYEAGSAWLPGVVDATEAFLDIFVAQDGSPSGIARSVAGNTRMTLRSG